MLRPDAAPPAEVKRASMIVRQYSPQNNIALLRIRHHFLERHGKLMSFHIHLSRADPSEAGVDQCAHLMRRRQLAGFQEILVPHRTTLAASR
jgi:hypothetical protein